jgi:peptidoglycan hydrolase CwlO-like protein
MQITKALAGLAAAAVLTLGASGVAYADTTSGGTTAPAATAAHKGCKNSEQRLAKLQARKAHLEARIDKLQKARDAARDKGRTEEAQRIEKRIDKLQKEHEKVVDRIAKLQQRCPVAPKA